MHSIRYNQDLGLHTLIQNAVGQGNIRNINPHITLKRFPFPGTGIREVSVRVEPSLAGEAGEQAANRLAKAGHVLASTGDLAAFQCSYPGVMAKWMRVLVLSKDSRWTTPDSLVSVPCARVSGTDCYFDLFGFRVRLNSTCGVLVLCE